MKKNHQKDGFLYYKNHHISGLQGLQAVLEYATIIDNDAE